MRHHEHRRHTLDRTDHARAARDRRGRHRGPSERDIRSALSTVEDHDVPGTPSVGAASTLQHVDNDALEAGTRMLRDVSVKPGDPEHGAHRSDPHIKRYKLDLPAREVDGEVLAGEACPECGHEMVRYKYRAHHFIAGSESLFCLGCEAKLWGEDWG